MPAVPLRTTALAAALLVLSGGLAAAIASDRLSPTVDPDISPWVVLLLSAGACGVMLVLAHFLSVADLGRRALPRPVPSEQVIQDLATLAGIADDQGLLGPLADKSLSRYPIVVSGLHLLCDDADRSLIRASLGSQSEAGLSRAASSRASAIFIAQSFRALSAIALVSSLALAALHATDPSAIGAGGASIIFGSVLASVISMAVATPAVTLLRRCAAADEFAAAASIETVLAIHDREGARAVRARLEALRHVQPPGRIPDQPRLAA
ncbi:MAG: hypothetical protein ACK4WH_12440 [Phycisphaerales bacterium]